MPKQKTNKAASERFKVTRKGKIMHRRQGHSHLLEHKSQSRKRRLKREGQLTGGDARQARRLMGRR